MSRLRQRCPRPSTGSQTRMSGQASPRSQRHSSSSRHRPSSSCRGRCSTCGAGEPPGSLRQCPRRRPRRPSNSRCQALEALARGQARPCMHLPWPLLLVLPPASPRGACCRDRDRPASAAARPRGSSISPGSRPARLRQTLQAPGPLHRACRPCVLSSTSSYGPTCTSSRRRQAASLLATPWQQVSPSSSPLRLPRCPRHPDQHLEEAPSWAWARPQCQAQAA